MLNYIKYHLSLASGYFSISIKKQMEWVMTIVSYSATIPINCITALLLIYVLVNRFSPLYGWNFNQLVFMYGLAYTVEGIATTFAAHIRRIEVYILRGDFDRNLLRPVSVLFQFIFRGIYLGGIIEVISGLIILVYGCQVTGFAATFFNIAKLVIVILGAALIRIAFLILVGAISFWTKRSGPLVWIADELVKKTTQYPITVYPDILQAVFTFILPFAFITFYPCSEFFGFSGLFNLPLNFALWTPLVGIFLFIISNKVFTYGLKKYESSGA